MHMRVITPIVIALVAMVGATRAHAEESAAVDTALVRATAFQAAIYGHPLLGMYRWLSEQVLDPSTRKAGFNQYFHWTKLSTPEASPFPAPNNDTLYSTAWLDLRREPAILEMPDAKGRFYTVQVMDMSTETIGNFGRRLYGTKKNVFAVVGPGWKGKLPPEVRAVARSETSFAHIIMRVLVDGPEDAPNVTALQQRFSIASLSRYRAGLKGAGDAEPFPPYKATTATERMTMLDRIIRASPVRASDRGMVASFAPLGVGPFTSSFKVATSEGLLAEAERDAKDAINQLGPRSGAYVNGWRVPPRAIGVYDVDYLQRASVWDGGTANVPEESFYPTALLDAAGQPLDGSAGRYVLRFPAGALPPARAFWSLTMYSFGDNQLVANPIGRYSIGDRTRGLRRDPDGSLSITIQADQPGEALFANWLPAPRKRFYLVLRLYGPEDSAISGRWTPPAIDRLH